MRPFRRKIARRGQLPEIMLTPMIDTFCVLLIIFIVAAPMVHNDIKVELPYGNSKEIGGVQELVVTLSKDNKILFNNYPLIRTDLVKSVQQALVNKEDTPVYVRADQSIFYGEVIKIVDELKLAGVRYVALSTRPF